MTLERVSAITVGVSDMRRSVRFYVALGFEIAYGGEDGDFTSLAIGDVRYNLAPRSGFSLTGNWGRTIFHVSDVDAFFQRALDAGLAPETEPEDASWGERYFHILDPDGHELSFAKPL